jgi:hypothetical protein
VAECVHELAASLRHREVEGLELPELSFDFGPRRP